MSSQKTLSIIKPDAVKAGYADAINHMIKNSGLKILKKKELQLSKEEAQQFYSVHSDKPFYDELCEFMTSGPIVVQILEGENAVELYRKAMGATNPEEAEENTKILIEQLQKNISGFSKVNISYEILHGSKINIVNNIIRDKSDIGYLVIASNNKGESPGELVEFISKSGFSIPVVVIPGDISNDNIDELVGIK